MGQRPIAEVISIAAAPCGVGHIEVDDVVRDGTRVWHDHLSEFLAHL